MSNEFHVVVADVQKTHEPQEVMTCNRS